MIKAIAFLLPLTSTIAFAGEPSPKDVVAQLYKAYGTEQSSDGETRIFTRYFDDELLKLYMKDKREAKGEVGRLDADPLYQRAGGRNHRLLHFSTKDYGTRSNRAVSLRAPFHARARARSMSANNIGRENVNVVGIVQRDSDRTTLRVPEN